LRLQSLVFDLSVKVGLAKNVHCCLTKIGFTLFTPNVVPGYVIDVYHFVTLEVTTAIPPPIQNYKTYPDLVSIT